MKPLVSIIIPTKDRQKELAILLQSIQQQTYLMHETIVVDQGQERNRQRAEGVQQAKGSYLMFLDSDMSLNRFLIEDCVSRCEKDQLDAVIIPECAGGNGFWADCQRLEKRCYLRDPHMEAANRFISREAYERVGGYRQDLIVLEDFDLHDRLVKSGAKIGRSIYYLNHYESGFWGTVAKKFYYGTKMGKVLAESPEKHLPRFAPVKPCFVRNWRLFAGDPLHGFGVIVMKGSQWLAGLAGLLVSIARLKLHKKHP